MVDLILGISQELAPVVQVEPTVCAKLSKQLGPLQSSEGQVSGYAECLPITLRLFSLKSHHMSKRNPSIHC